MIILEDRTQGGTLNEKLISDDQFIEQSFNIAPSPNFDGKSYLIQKSFGLSFMNHKL